MLSSTQNSQVNEPFYSSKQTYISLTALATVDEASFSELASPKNLKLDWPALHIVYEATVDGFMGEFYIGHLRPKATAMFWKNPIPKLNLRR